MSIRGYSRLRGALCAAAALALTASASAASADPTRVHLDEETVVGGVPVGCTGIGQTKNQPKWLTYPVRVEFADAQRAYLAGEDVTVSDMAGNQVLEVTCEGPWLLFKLPAGQSFKVDATLTEGGGGSGSTTVAAPAHGQKRFVIIFPGAH